MSDKKPNTTKATGKTAKPPKVAAPKQFDREAEEAILIKKYTEQRIVRGTLRDAGEVPQFGQKRSVEIICQGDGKTKRRIATSDLHQVKYSEDYIKKIRLKRRKELRADKSKDRPARVAKALKAPKDKAVVKKTVRATKKPKSEARKPEANIPETVGSA